ncbi:DNA helicase [Mycena venus]|uniref:DNA helicase n=1 Tax=Mycena venus TaxID=2733690 RepID=A0A8H7CAB6_9AGAR|nr:DNA helicase [Mycena venus]
MSSKRGRKRNDNLPPNRARDVQRAFRARRAAHLQALEDRVAELEEENSCLRQALNLPQANRPPLGKGPTGKDKPKALYDTTHNHHALTHSSRESSSADSPDSLRESLSPAIVSATLPPRSAVQEIENGTGVWGQTIVMTEEDYQPLPPMSAPPMLQSKMAPYSSPVSHPSSRSSSLAPMYNLYNPNDRNGIPTYPGYFEAQQQQQQQQQSYSYSSPHNNSNNNNSHTLLWSPPCTSSTGDLQALGGHYPHTPLPQTPLPQTPLGIRLPSPPRALQDQQHPQQHDVHTMHNHGHHSQLDPHAHHRPAYTADGRIIS